MLPSRTITFSACSLPHTELFSILLLLLLSSKTCQAFVPSNFLQPRWNSRPDPTANQPFIISTTTSTTTKPTTLDSSSVLGTSRRQQGANSDSGDNSNRNSYVPFNKEYAVNRGTGLVPGVGGPPLGSSTTTVTASRGFNDTVATTTKTAGTRERDRSTTRLDIPSLQELFGLATSIRTSMEQKSQAYKSMIRTLELEYDQSRRTLQDWNEKYYKKMEQIKAKDSWTEEQAMLESKDGNFTQTLTDLREEALRKEASSTEKIYWLADKLQQLKFNAHKQQLETAQAAKAQQEELQKRLELTTAELEQQMKQVTEQGSKARENWSRRMEIERELAEVKKEFQSTVQKLQSQLTSMQESHRKDKEQAKQELAMEREQAQKQLNATKEEAERQKEALTLTLQNKENDFHQTIERLRKEAEEKQKALQANLETTSTQLQNFKLQGQQDLMREREFARAQQNDLQARIAEKEEELKSQTALAKQMVSKADEYWKQRMELEKELSVLKHAYETAVHDWQKRRSELLAEIAKEKNAATSIVEYTKRKASEDIEQAVTKATTEYKSIIESMKARLSHSNAKIQQVQESSLLKEKDLKKQLQSISNMFQEFKFEAHKTLESEKDAARAMQDQLKQKMGKLENDLEKQKAMTLAQAARADDLWKRRMELESELSALTHKYSADVSLWEQRYRKLQMERSKEQQANKALLAWKESEARKQIAAAVAETEQAKLTLKESIRQKDLHYTDEINSIRAEAAKKEKELSLKLQTVGNGLQEYKLEAHKALMAEKEASSKKQQQLQSEIDRKLKELGEQAKMTEIQRRKVDELSQSCRSLEVELSAIRKQALEAEEQKMALMGTLSSKETTLNDTISKIRSELSQKEHDLMQKLELSANELRSLRSESQRQLLSEQEKARTEQSKLDAVIKSKEKELEQQISKTKEMSQKVESERKQRTELENELLALRGTYSKVVTDWQNRYDQLQQAYLTEKKELEQLLNRAQSNAKKDIDEALAQAAKEKTALEEAIRSMDVKYNRKLQRVRELEERCASVEQARESDKISFAHELAQVKAASDLEVKAAMNQAESALQKSMAVAHEREKELKQEIDQMTDLLDKFQSVLQAVTAPQANGLRIQ